MTNLENWQNANKIALNTIEENDGKLTLIEINKEIPFEVRRIFLIHSVPSVETIRGNHASENTDFFIQAICGTVRLELFDGKKTEIYQLNNLMYGVYVPRMTWVKMYGFSNETIVQVCASKEYKYCKYINDSKEYMKQLKNIWNN